MRAVCFCCGEEYRGGENAPDGFPTSGVCEECLPGLTLAWSEGVEPEAGSDTELPQAARKMWA